MKTGYERIGPKFRFHDGTRILGTLIKKPTDFSKPVFATVLPDLELIPGQEKLLEQIEHENRYSLHSGWAARTSDFYGEPFSTSSLLKYRRIDPTGVFITPKFLGQKDLYDGVYDGQMGFHAEFVRWRPDLPAYNGEAQAEFTLYDFWQRFVDTPLLYTT